MRKPGNKSLMRNLGEFFGHVYKAVRTDRNKKRIVVNKSTEEQNHGEMTLRRTTIDEIEFNNRSNKAPKADS